MKGMIRTIALVLIGIIIGVGGLWAYNYFTGGKIAASAVKQVEQTQVNDLLAKVGKLVILPTGETPVVATINDAAALIKEQVFYKGAKNGDVVIVYQKAAKAIVYSPSRNIIVNVGPVFLQDQANQTAASASTTKK